MTTKNSIVVVLWNNDSSADAFGKLGDGLDLTRDGDWSGSVNISFRDVELRDGKRRIGWTSSYRAEAADIKLRIRLVCDGEFSMEFLTAFDAANQQKVELTLKLLKTWNAKADKLNMGGKESFDTTLRRMLAATGVKSSLVINNQFSDEHGTLSIEDTIRSYITPAVAQIRSKLKVNEPETA